MTKIKNLKFKIKNFGRGFTLLLALITMGVVLVVGLAVYTIILKEIQLSGLGRESLIAFYAADSGTECVFYWDIKRGEVSTITPSNVECLGQSFSIGGAPISSFKLNFDNGSCVKVNINKSNPVVTQIDSYGYNFDCDSNLPRKVERGVRVTY